MSEKKQKQGWFKCNLSWIAVFLVIAFLSIIPFYVFKFLPYIAKRAEVRIDAGISANIASYGVVLAALASVFTAFILVLQWNEQRKQRDFIAQQTDILSTQQRTIEEQLQMQREERFSNEFSRLVVLILETKCSGPVLYTDHPNDLTLLDGRKADKKKDEAIRNFKNRMKLNDSYQYTFNLLERMIDLADRSLVLEYLKINIFDDLFAKLGRERMNFFLYIYCCINLEARDVFMIPCMFVGLKNIESLDI